MKHLKLKFFRIAALATLMVLSASGVLQAQPADPDDIVSGIVVDAKTQAPIANAAIAVFHSGRKRLQETKTKTDGGFSCAPLLNGRTRQAEDFYILLVRAEGYETITEAVKVADAQEGKSHKIEMDADNPRKILVTDTQGKPIANASAQMEIIYAAPPNEKTTTSAPSGRDSLRLAMWQLYDKWLPAKSDADGIVTITGLPANGADVLFSAPGYAKFRPEAWELGRGPVRLSRETVIEGKFIFEDTGQPFLNGKGFAKVQAWRKYRLWRQAPMAADGSFEVVDIPSLEVMGEKSLSIMLEFGIQIGQFITAPGMRLGYAPRSYNAFVTLEENGQTKWYISYVDDGGELKYSEGERIHHDILLHPLARITGRVLQTLGNAPARISYHDPASDKMYGDWAVQTDADGKFEIFAPVGNVTLKFQCAGKSGELLIKDLQAHETREVELLFEPKP